MSWRTVVIASSAKLDYQMGYLVVRREDVKKIFLDEISILIIENTAVSLTAALLSAMTKKKIKVIFCDEKRNPSSELIPYSGSYNSSLKIRNQIRWNNSIKEEVWTVIVSDIIRKQAEYLQELNMPQAELLLSYLKDLREGDSTNREGHAAKVYFNGIFGMEFTRRDDENVINAALNYGYSIILSAFNREVISNGFITQLGLAHDNQFNHYNLSCDLMEPFRVFVDRDVSNREYEIFGKEEKHQLADILNSKTVIRNNEQTLLNAIKIYTKSVFDALYDNNVQLIKFAEL